MIEVLYDGSNRGKQELIKKCIFMIKTSIPIFGF